MGCEEIPPGKWRTDEERRTDEMINNQLSSNMLKCEEIPPGGWRGDDDINNNQHFFKHYEIGHECENGEKIKNILGRNPNLIVFITEGKELRYETSNKFSDKKTNIIKVYHSYSSKIRMSVPDSHKENAYIYLGHALYSAFLSDDEEPMSLFNDVENYIFTSSKEKAKIFYLLSGLVSSIIISLIIILTRYFILTNNDYEYLNIFFIASFCGVWGALISIFQRSKNFSLDPFTSIFYISFQSTTIIVLGLIFGCLFILAYKAKLILGILDGNIYTIELFSVLSGFSERFIPELLNKIDYEK